VIGTRTRIQNDRPIIGAYGVNDESSGDKYYKGGNMLHTIRQLVDDDDAWRGILRGLNATFWHQTVTSAQIEDYIADQAGFDLSAVFDEYLRTTLVPTLEWRMSDGKLSFRWTDVVPGFAMPVRVMLQPGRPAWIHPTERWQEVPVGVSAEDFLVDPNFYVRSRQVPATGG